MTVGGLYIVDFKIFLWRDGQITEGGVILFSLAGFW